jgi:hypothetical protein
LTWLRSVKSILLVAVLLVAGQALSAPLSAAGGQVPPAVPKEIAVPSGAVLLFSRHARGVQIYACPDGEWTLRAPRALLFDPQSRRPTGIHYGGVDRGLTPGPWWESARDDSRVRAARVDEAPSPNADSIPLLLLKAVEWHGSGAFSPVSYIQRLNTVGGVSPTGACPQGAQRRVPYTADYYFYGDS